MLRYRMLKWMSAARRNAINTLAWTLPKSIVMACFIRVAAVATMGAWSNEDPNCVSIIDAAKRFDKSK